MNTITPPSRSRGPLLIVGISVLALIIVAAAIFGLVWADDSGTLNTGLALRLSFLHLSSLTGGLSPVPADASIQVAKAFQSRSSFAYSGTFTGFTPTTSTAPTSGTTSSSATTSTTPASTSTTPLSDTTPTTATEPTTPLATDPLSRDTQFNFSAVGQNYSLQSTINDAGVGVQSEYRVVGGQLYVSNIFGSTDNTTTSSTGADTPVWTKAGPAPSVTVDAVKNWLSSAIARASYVGQVVVAGDNALQFQASVAGSDIPAISAFATSTLADWQKSNGALDISVSRKTHLPTHIHLALTVQTKTITFDAVSQPAATAEIVAPQNAVDASSTFTPDQQRKSDLATISAALEKYKIDKGAYPVSTTIDRLDQGASVVNVALVPAYLPALPKDVNTVHYYGYISDGRTFELSAVLDNTKDPDGVTVGSVFLYLLKNTATTPTP